MSLPTLVDYKLFCSINFDFGCKVKAVDWELKWIEVVIYFVPVARVKKSKSDDEVDY